ncbi:MAG: GNAT family N-acetyltransferase [Peptostreptococcus sp.]|uniref:GNAT family N-acetyltransferase n=1 Tax=Peptostreptococcus sp. TaxID=1262 RepID=UPI002FCC0EE6
MNIRLCNKNETSQVKDIWKYCFNDSDEYVEFYFKYKFNPQNTIVLEDEGNIISSLHLNQHKIHLNFKEYETSYVVGVSTLPEARGIGKMNDLMNKSLRHMYDLDQSVSILMPIDFRLYTKYGYENCYDMLVQKLSIYNLRKYKTNGIFKRADNAGDLEDIYSCAVSRYNGYAIRDTKYFEEFIEEMRAEKGYIYINYRDGVPVGYIVYSIDSDDFNVRECYYKDIISYKSLLKFIFNHNTQCKNVTMNSPMDDPLRFMLDNPRESSFEISPFMMARIINFSKLIDELDVTMPYPELENGEEILIGIKDDQIEENNGIFKMYTEDRRLKTEKVGDLKDKNDDLDVFTINELTCMCFSYHSIDEIDHIREKKIANIIDIRDIFSNIKNELTINHINEYV